LETCSKRASFRYKNQLLNNAWGNNGWFSQVYAKHIKKRTVLDIPKNCWTLEEGTDRLSRNISN